MIITRVGPVHKGCYTCFTCHRYLTPANVVQVFFEMSSIWKVFEKIFVLQVDELYCTNCYKLKMMSRMSTPTICSTTSIMADTEGRDRCPRCMGKVFKAEQVLTSNAVYHKSCFRCAEVECGKHLDSSNYCDSEQGNNILHPFLHFHFPIASCCILIFLIYIVRQIHNQMRLV